MEHKRVRRPGVEIKDKGLFKGLRICKKKTYLGNPPSVLKKKEALRVPKGESTFLRTISPTF